VLSKYLNKHPIRHIWKKQQKLSSYYKCSCKLVYTLI
jgi:hypothetical protein